MSNIPETENYYPTDPTSTLIDLLEAIKAKDTKKLIASVYDLIGYALYLAEGQNPTGLAQLRVSAQPIFDHIGEHPESVPPWLLPLLIHILEGLQSLKK